MATIPTPTAVRGAEVKQVVEQAKEDGLASPPATVTAGQTVVRRPFPSPEDWRDVWIYFLLVDRFNNPAAPPRSPDPCLPYQGGTFEGIKRELPYLKGLGAGALWLSPVLMNPQAFEDYYGGYATQDFLRIEPRPRDVRRPRHRPQSRGRPLQLRGDARRGPLARKRAGVPGVLAQREQRRPGRVDRHWRRLEPPSDRRRLAGRASAQRILPPAG